jgi:hypothetical protein
VLGAAASLVAIGAAAIAVLRDIAAFDRPPAAPPVVAPPVVAPPVVVPPVAAPPVAGRAPVVVAPVVVAPAVVAPQLAGDDGSMLGTLAATEADERPALRRVGSGLVLLAVTLVTAGLVGVLIYRGLAGLG